MANDGKKSGDAISGPIFEIVQQMGESTYPSGGDLVQLDVMNRKTLEIPLEVQEMHLALEAQEASKKAYADLQSRPTVEVPAPDRQTLFEYLDRPYK